MNLPHIQNRDTLIMTVTATFAGAISMLGNFAMFFGGGRDRGGIGIIGSLVAMLLAPFAASIIQMAISRTREYAADKRGAEICGNPVWLADALRRISGAAQKIPNPVAEKNPATAHMFIINPLGQFKRDNLFSTHPNTENRVTALINLAESWAQEEQIIEYADDRRSNDDQGSWQEPASNEDAGDNDAPWGRPR